jgi:hypothetical protein
MDTPDTTSPFAGSAIALVRLWTRLYTWRMPPLLREARLEEIESDLWECQHDPADSDGRAAVQIFARLFIGMPSDLCWRIEQRVVERQLFGTRITLAAAAAVVMGALWVLPAWYSQFGPDDRRRINDCADTATATSTGSLTRADYQMQVITCAGAFFAPPRSRAVTP